MPCFDKVINICKPYITESNGDGVSGSTKGKEAFNGGRETGFLRRHLEGVDKGHLGIEYHRRVSNTPCGDSHPTSNTPRRGVLPRTQSSIIRGDTGTPPKRSNYPTIRKCNRFCLHPLLSTEEERSDEASDQPETVESLGGDPPLQDGGNSYPSGSPPPRRLDGESGFEGCLFHHPHPPGSPEISEVHGGRDLLSVHLPAIRPVLRPMDFHQGNETINDSAEVMGYQDNYLYRRHVDTGQLQGGGHTTPGSTCTPPGIPGLHHQSGEITPIPSPGNRISGTDCGLAGHPAQASGEKLRQIRKEATHLLTCQVVSAHQLSQFIGKLNATAQAIQVAPLFYRALQANLQEALAVGNQNYNQMLPLGTEAQEELRWWQHHLTQWNGKTTIRKSVQIVIQSDASLSGWGAVCNGVSTGGSWTPQEQLLHINCLELLAADLALKSFLKDQQRAAVLLQLDNSTAVAYINNLGGTISPALTALARTLWLWALERDIAITAQHIPGVSNTVADCESRMERDRSDWMLAPQVFHKINEALGPLEIDLFASRLTYQLPRFFSWRPDPQAAAVDAFQQDWSQLRGYANPPWCLMGRVLSKVESQQAQVILVAPVWRAQTWYPVLLRMLRDYPRLLSPQEAQM